MEDSKEGVVVLDGQESTEIQSYLNSFKKEIQDDSDDIQGNKSGDEGAQNKVKKSQEVLTYFAGADGMLYIANPSQGTPQPVAVLAGTNGENQNDPNLSGLHQVVFTRGESGNLVLSDSKNVTYSIPMTISSQGLSAKENGSSEENPVKLPTLVVMQPASCIGQDQMIPLKRDAEDSISQGKNELTAESPQIFQMVSELSEQEGAEVAVTADGNVTVVKGCDSYQTVTVVPSDTNPGQLNYVLFLSPENEESDSKVEENSNISEYVLHAVDKDSNKFVAIDGEIEDQLSQTYVKSSVQNQTNMSHVCKYCDYTSNKRYLLSRHMKSHSDERPHICGVCERGFKTVASLQNHVNTHTKTRPHACKECESCFTTSGELVRHMRYKHTHEKPHRCTECDYASVELSKLKRHMRCHTGERPYQCPHCTYASPDTYKLKRHMRIHTGEKPYVCDICQSRFTQSNSLKAHRLIHSGNKPAFPCQYCPTTCGRKTDLRIHIQKLHSCDKMHKCKRCGKIFKDRYSFKLHCKTHDGEKSLKCAHCPYATISQQQLETHSAIHNNEEFFQCALCGQGFLQKQLLKQHINLNHNSNYIPPASKEKNIECTECGKAFRHHGNMIRHLAIHDPEASPSEREEAMQIGRQKEPGEIKDGEEDELSDDDDIDNDQVVVFELINLSKFSENGNQILTTPDGQILALEGNNVDGYTIIPQPSTEDMQNALSSCSDPEKIGNELGIPLTIEFEGDDSDSEVNKNYCEKRKFEGESESRPNKSRKKVNKPPQIIQITSEQTKSSTHATNGNLHSNIIESTETKNGAESMDAQEQIKVNVLTCESKESEEE